MQNTELMPDEKIISKRKPAILIKRGLWIGLLLIVFALVLFVFGLQPGYRYLDLPISYLTSSVGIDLYSIGSLPIIPSVLEILGLIEVVVAELSVYFTDYIVTDRRILILSMRGIGSKAMDVVLPNKISNISMVRTLSDRLLGLGRISIELEETARPSLTLIGIKNPYEFQNDMLNLVNKSGKA